MNYPLIHFFLFQVISHILSFLNLPDLKSAILTCRLWYDLSHQSWFTNKVLLTLSKMQLSKEDSKIYEIMNQNTRYFSSISLNFVNCVPLYKTLWKKFGSRLTEVKLIYVSLRTEELFEMLKYMPKLKNLQLNANGTLFTTIDYATDNITKQNAFEILSRLQTLKMRIKMTKELFEHFFGASNRVRDFEFIENNSSYQYVEGTQLTCSDFGRFIEKNKSFMENIRLQIDSCDSAFIYGLYNMKKLKLKSFQIQKLDCDDKLFNDFCKQQNGIEVFESTNLRAGHLTSIVRHLTKLQELYISNSSDALNELKEIKNLKNLRHLSLCFADQVSDSILFEIFNEKRENLITLRYENNVNSEGLTRISEMCPNLKELYLNFNHNSPIRGIQIIFKNLTRLEILSIEQSGSVIKEMYF